jgi:acetyl esterase/lipase
MRRLPLVGALIAAAAISAAQAGGPASPAMASPVETAASVRATQGSLLRPATRWHTYRDLRYSDAGAGDSTSLDLYVPDNGADQVPLIVWIHGGGWIAGSKDKECAPRDADMMSRGFAVACMNYRLTPEAEWPAQIVDVKSAIRALRVDAARYRLYGPKIGVWGASAGGHLAAMAGAAGNVPEWDVGANLDVSSRVQAVVDDFGPTDLLSDVRDQSSPPIEAAQEMLITSLIGGPRHSNPDNARSASPAYWVDGDEPPFVIWHGDQDKAVPLSQSRELRDRLRAVGVPVQFTVGRGIGHGGPRAYGPERIQALAEFFDVNLRPGT